MLPASANEVTFGIERSLPVAPETVRVAPPDAALKVANTPFVKLSVAIV